jgi:hypothetical protein
VAAVQHASCLPQASSVPAGTPPIPARPRPSRRHLSLHAPEPDDLDYLAATLDRECRKLGGQGVRRTGGAGSLLLDLAPQRGE